MLWRSVEKERDYFVRDQKIIMQIAVLLEEENLITGRERMKLYELLRSGE